MSIERMKITRKLTLAALSVTVLLAGSARWAHASGFGGFSVRAVVPDNQIDKDLTYFDLRMQRGQKQTVQLLVRNSDDQPITAHVSLAAAATGRGGVIVYDQSNRRDESLKTSITDIAVVVNPQILVPASGDAMVDVEIQMPDEPFDGVILGGLTVTADRPGDATVRRNAVNLSNEYAYTVGLKISENDKEVQPDLHLKSIEPGLVNYRTALYVNLQNSEPVVMKGIDLSAQVYKRGSQEVLRELKRTGAEMAPNSNGDFVVEWDGAPLQPDDYRLAMTARYGEWSWTWDEPFSIGADEAGAVNGNALNLPAKGTPPWVYGVAAALFLSAVLLLTYRVGRRGTVRR